MQDNNKFLHDWLRRRGITDEVIFLSKIRWGMTPTMGEGVIIPVCDERGDVLFNKYRRDPRDDAKPKYTYDKGGKTALYNIEHVLDSDVVLITEGELDALVAMSANIPAVSSTGGALSFQREWAPLFADKKVIICYDNDDAGAQGAVKTLTVIPHASVAFIPEIAGVKDITDFVARGGDLHALIATAKHYDGVEHVYSDRAERLATWLPTRFHDAYIEANTEKVFASAPRRTRASADGDEVARAKEYPIGELVKFVAGKAPCLWHNEKTASMHYYAENNHVYCFGCGKSADSIDVLRALRGCSFTEAINFLKK